MKNNTNREIVIGWNESPVHICYTVIETAGNILFKGTINLALPVEFSYQIIEGTQEVFIADGLNEMYQELIIDAILTDYDKMKTQN